ncbi:MAG: glutamate ligase domain-containing protein, partial [Pyrinomonadaceae bacterium]
RAKYKGSRVVAVFEPRSATSRLAVFQDDYVDALRQADHVIVANVFNRGRAGDNSQPLLDTDDLAAGVASQGTPAFCFDGADEIVRHLAAQLRDGDVVAIMSNGGFGGIHEKLLGALREQGSGVGGRGPM